jgi:hypothetical protein
MRRNWDPVTVLAAPRKRISIRAYCHPFGSGVRRARRDPVSVAPGSFGTIGAGGEPWAKFVVEDVDGRLIGIGRNRDRETIFRGAFE